VLGFLSKLWTCSFCLHFKTKKKKILRIFKKKSRISKNLNFFTKLKTFETHFFKFLSFINLTCGHVMSHKKFGPDRFSRFDVYWIQTDKQTDSQAKFIYRWKKASFPRLKSVKLWQFFKIIFQAINDQVTLLNKPHMKIISFQKQNNGYLITT